MTRRDRIIRKHLRHRLVITMRDGLTWEAVITDADDRTFSLWDATAIQPDKTRVPADGEVLIFRTDVLYLQSVAEMQRP